MTEAPIFRQSALYKTGARLRQVGRFALLLWLPVLALLFWFPRDGRFVHPRQWWGYLFFFFVAFSMIGIWGDVLIAALLRCDRCGRRPTLVWHVKHRPRLTEREAIREFFFPSELHAHTFACEHCAAHFRLA